MALAKGSDLEPFLGQFCCYYPETPHPEPQIQHYYCYLRQGQQMLLVLGALCPQTAPPPPTETLRSVQLRAFIPGGQKPSIASHCPTLECVRASIWMGFWVQTRTKTRSGKNFFLAVLGLCCCVDFSLVVVRGLLIEVASLSVECRL